MNKDSSTLMTDLLINTLEWLWLDAPTELQTNSVFEEHVCEVLKKVRAQCNTIQEGINVGGFGRAGDTE